MKRIAALVACTVIAACSSDRERDTVPRCATWKGSIGEELSTRCGECHGGADPDGNYDLTTYLGMLGDGTDDVPNAIAGDATSAIVSAIDPATADDTHSPFTDLYPTIRDWVVDCRISYVSSAVHGGGVLNPHDDAEFHGKVLAELSYDLNKCASCHGQDFAGGRVEVSCLTCHENGPTDCTTCHGDSPTSGSHAAHVLGSDLDKKLDCSECHIKPDSWDSVGHIRLADGSIDPPPAEVRFGSLANQGSAGGAGRASFDPESKVCSNVYCHGGRFDDSNATDTAPVWGGASSQAACGTCHGLSPSNHGGAERCSYCHEGIADDTPAVLDTQKHLDGQIESVGDSCNACHGSDDSGGPPPDLAGNTDTAAPGVGAHQSHLQAPSGFSPPMQCSSCHLAPASVLSAGHVDNSPGAEVFPDVPGFNSRALARGAEPVYDRATATCQDVYCHGGGPAMQSDQSASVNRNPVWTQVGTGQVVCGSCHGLPPTTGFHNPSITRDDCHVCHPNTVDAAGDIIVTGAPGQETSAHMNGVVDAF